jgi:gamma-tubulin complex component 5
MIPSSTSSGLSAPSSSRPSSSLSVSRPSSSASHRPPSSLSTTRPSSSTARPHSRYSQRPHSRHARSRLVPICQTLITQVTGLLEDGTPSDEHGEKFRSLVEYAVKSLESTTIHKAAVSVDMGVVDRQISGWVHLVLLCTLALICDS